MSKTNYNFRSCSPSKEELKLVNELIYKFGDVRTTKRLDLLWNSSVGKNVPNSSKIAKERWAAVKKFNQHEYQFWLKLTEIANLKHKLLYPNYKYTPIRDKNKKSRKSNNTYKQHPSLVANDIVKSTKIESNKKFEPLQIQETNNTQASTDNNNCQNNSTSPNLSIEPISESYLPSSFLPNYLSHEYRQNILAPSMMPVQFTNNLNPYYL
ncbi:3179_t:CDS:2 [Dentiscutata erythropus]|uniref:3179_t:CDS:1 n=1 Tax=Dentiscutata erythropus TaxID=1348616 RepID=A0A9N9JKI6_9GLOM|nr:3179_t:CDS:2 [Dentiscutata erythropus]